MPLVVDLDGALVHADLVAESLMLLAKRRPWRVVPVLATLADGRARFKKRLAAEVIPEIRTLPFDPASLTFLERQRGRAGVWCW